MVVWLAPITIPDPKTNRVIILGISLETYSLSFMENHWRSYVAGAGCWGCGRTGCFLRHGRYWKYLYDSRIGILRVRCSECGRTHALIPEFSLPRSSVGTVEVEQYLSERAAGASRSKAAKVLFEKGLCAGYPKRLDHKVMIVTRQAKALWPSHGEAAAHGLQWIASLLGSHARVVVDLNRFALERGVNCLWYSLRPISPGRRRSAGGAGFT